MQLRPFFIRLCHSAKLIRAFGAASTRDRLAGALGRLLEPGDGTKEFEGRHEFPEESVYPQAILPGGMLQAAFRPIAKPSEFFDDLAFFDIRRNRGLGFAPAVNGLPQAVIHRIVLAQRIADLLQQGFPATNMG